MKAMAFFPIIADGFESSSVLTEQLTTWQYALTSCQLTHRLPCMLGVYTRLSQERSSHD